MFLSPEKSLTGNQNATGRRVWLTKVGIYSILRFPKEHTGNFYLMTTMIKFYHVCWLNNNFDILIF